MHKILCLYAYEYNIHAQRNLNRSKSILYNFTWLKLTAERIAWDGRRIDRLGNKTATGVVKNRIEILLRDGACNAMLRHSKVTGMMS